MTMHMLPVYYTTTNSKKRRKKNKMANEDPQLQKLLKRVGYVKDHDFRYDVPDYQVSKSNVKTSDAVGNGFKNMAKQYTGDELAGIGTLHKSNMVPVRKDSNDAKEIARMRRG